MDWNRLLSPAGHWPSSLKDLGFWVIFGILCYILICLSLSLMGDGPFFDLAFGRWLDPNNPRHERRREKYCARYGVDLASTAVGRGLAKREAARDLH